MRRRALVLAVFALIASACDSDAVETDSSEAAVGAVETTTTEPAATDAPTTTTVEPSTTTTGSPDPLDGVDFQYSDPEMIPSVRVIDAGAEPRSVRVWSPQVGSTTAMTVVTTVAAEQEFAGSVVTTDFSATIETAYEALLGTEVFQITRPDGAIVAEAGLDDVTGGVFDSGLGGASSPLPLEPIGIGAIWEIDQIIDTEGVRIIQTVTTTLTDVIDSRLFVEVVGVVSLDPESPALAGLGAVTLEGSTTGSAVWDLELGMASVSTAESTQVVSDESNPDTSYVASTTTRIDIEARPTG